MRPKAPASNTGRPGAAPAAAVSYPGRREPAPGAAAGPAAAQTTADLAGAPEMGMDARINAAIGPLADAFAERGRVVLAYGEAAPVVERDLGGRVAVERVDGPFEAVVARARAERPQRPPRRADRRA